MNNPFPRPNRTSEENKKVIRWLDQMVKSKTGLKFYDCMQRVEELVERKDKEMATIAAYYVTNIIINRKSMSQPDKTEIILGLKEQLDKLSES